MDTPSVSQELLIIFCATAALWIQGLPHLANRLPQSRSLSTERHIQEVTFTIANDTQASGPMGMVST